MRPEGCMLRPEGGIMNQKVSDEIRTLHDETRRFQMGPCGCVIEGVVCAIAGEPAAGYGGAHKVD